MEVTRVSRVWMGYPSLVVKIGVDMRVCLSGIKSFVYWTYLQLKGGSVTIWFQSVLSQLMFFFVTSRQLVLLDLGTGVLTVAIMEKDSV